jgi:hypothetical protein
MIIFEYVAGIVAVNDNGELQLPIVLVDAER